MCHNLQGSLVVFELPHVQPEWDVLAGGAQQLCRRRQLAHGQRVQLLLQTVRNEIQACLAQQTGRRMCSRGSDHVTGVNVCSVPLLYTSNSGSLPPLLKIAAFCWPLNSCCMQAHIACQQRCFQVLEWLYRVRRDRVMDHPV